MIRFHTQYFPHCQAHHHSVSVRRRHHRYITRTSSVTSAHTASLATTTGATRVTTRNNCCFSALCARNFPFYSKVIGLSPPRLLHVWSCSVFKEFVLRPLFQPLFQTSLCFSCCQTIGARLLVTATSRNIFSCPPFHLPVRVHQSVSGRCALLPRNSDSPSPLALQGMALFEWQVVRLDNHLHLPSCNFGCNLRTPVFQFLLTRSF